MILRYALLVIIILFYYAQFALPLFSTGAVPTQQDGGFLWLSGPTWYQYHYMSVGLIPIILSGLLIHLSSWIGKGQIAFLADFGKGWRHHLLVYTVAATIALTLVNKAVLPDYATNILMFTELMIGFWSLDTLQRAMKRLNVIKAPVTLLLALNVFGAFVFTIVSERAIGEKGYWVLLAASTALLCFLISRWRTPLTLSHYSINQDVICSTKIEFPTLIAGIMPVIYVSIMFSILSPFINALGLSSPVLSIVNAIVIFALLLVITQQCAWLQRTPKQLALTSEDYRLFPKSRRSSEDEYRLVMWVCVIKSTAVTGFLVLLEMYWMQKSVMLKQPALMVGGIGFLLILSALDDLMIHYKESRMISKMLHLLRSKPYYAVT